MANSKLEQQLATHPKRSRFWRWTKRVFMGLVGLVIVLLLTGAIYQFVTTRMDEGKYPPPGRLVDVGGYRLHLHCTGAGTPTVVLDAGLGGGMLDWMLVQPEVAKFSRVCSYDRAGVGWSEAGTQPRTSQQISHELHTLLGNAGIQAPYVLVGHSFGGINMQYFASQHPDEVAGVVLVDSSHENQFSQKEMPKPPSFIPSLTKVLAPLGVARMINKMGDTPPNIAPDLAVQRASIYSHTRHLYAVADEMVSLSVSLEQARAVPFQLGNKPLVVLTRGKKEAVPFLSPEETDRMEQAWKELQAELAGRSQNGKQIIAEKSGHYIQFDQPDLVLDAIRQTTEAARRTSLHAKQE
jgi:pimeloyl-ACP methyl ester carboxylesterase